MSRNVVSWFLLVCICVCSESNGQVGSSTSAQDVNATIRALAERSGDGEIPVVVSIKNTLRSAVTVYWVNERGEEEDFGTVEAGASFEQESFDSQLWRFKVGDKVVAKYRASVTPEQTFDIVDQVAEEEKKRAEQLWQQQKNGLRQSASGLNRSKVESAPKVVVPTTPTPGKLIGTPMGSALTEAQAATVLEFHNDARAEVGVEPLVWSNSLAKFAQEWADHLATTGKYEHRGTTGRFAQRYGENIAIHSKLEGGLEMWYAENTSFDPDQPVPANIASFKAAHYSQMVWRKTTEIGAGAAVIKEGPYKGMLIIVCNYKSPGNYAGEKAY